MQHRPQKASAIIYIQKQMMETREWWRKNRDMHIDLDKSRLCGKCIEGVNEPGK